MNKIFLEIKEINSNKIIFKSNYAWAFCLNANQENKNHYYSLPNNSLNQQKLKKLLPKLNFSLPLEHNNSSLFLELRDYQSEDVEFFVKLKSGAIFSEMRTGKTPIALFTWKKWGVTNLLIIAPSILQNHWQKSLAEWLISPSYIITYLDKSIRHFFYEKLLQSQELVIIISKDTFKIDSSYFQKLKKRKASTNNYCVIIDEAHFLRNYQSQQSKSIYVLRDAAYKLVITGTPIVNHYTDIFGILKFLQPEVYSSYWKFAEEYFAIQQWEFRYGKKKNFPLRQVKDFKNLECQRKLQEKINQISVNRKQNEVLPWLPKVIYHQEYLLMEEEQQNIYLRWIEKWTDYQPLEILAKLKTLTLYPPIFGFNCRGSKVNYLLNYLKEKKQRQIIIFSTRSETFLIPLAKILEEQKIEAGLITGQTSPADKQKIIQNFQNSTLKILLCNIQAAGLGLNLSKADTAIFADRSYAPADNEQAEARFLPTNDQENKRVRLIIDLICRGTIDEKIQKLLRRKDDIIKVLNSQPDYFFN